MQQKSKFYFYGRKKPTFIYSLMKSWHKTLVKYENKTEYLVDLPYWNIERTNIGFLATAANNLKALPLEEFSAILGPWIKQKTGRADLWILDKENNCYDIEAKWCEISLNSPYLSQTIESKLQESVDDVRKLKDKSDVSLGIVFIVPYVKGKTHNYNSYLKKISDLNSYNADFAGVHIAPRSLWEDYQYEGYYYPGITIVGRYSK